MLKLKSSFLYQNISIYLIFFSLYSVLVFFLSFNDHFVQDEVFTINAVHYGWNDLLKYISSSDVHPAGSYLIIKALREITGSFYVTRFILALVGGFFWFLALSILKNEKKISDILFFFAIPLNPAVLMWCVSLRWYSIWIPAITALSVYIFIKGMDRLFEFKSLISFAVLSYLSYLTFFIFATVIFIYFMKEKKINLKKTGMVLIFIVSVIPLMSEFLEKAERFSMHQSGTILQSVLISGYTVIAGSTFFPFNPFPVIYTVTVIFLLFKIKWNELELNDKNLFLFILTLSILLVFSGAGVKFKSSIVSHVVFTVFLIRAADKTVSERFRTLFGLVFILYSISGIINIVFIKDTVKITYNLPVNEVVRHYGNSFKKDNTAVCTDNISFEYHLKEKDVSMSNYNKDITEIDKDVLLVETYECFQRGGCVSSLFLGKKDYVCVVEKIKKDSFNKIKSLLHGAELPEYYVNLTLCNRKK